MKARLAIETQEYDDLSELEIMIEEKIEELREIYNKYKRNII